MNRQLEETRKETSTREEKFAPIRWKKRPEPLKKSGGPPAVMWGVEGKASVNRVKRRGGGH